MQPLGTKVYLLKRYSPSDSFCTFFFESVLPRFFGHGWIRFLSKSRKLPSSFHESKFHDNHDLLSHCQVRVNNEFLMIKLINGDV